MKKILYALIILFLPLFAWGTEEPLLKTTQDVLNLIAGIRNWLYAIFLVAAVISFLVAAFYFITATGSEEKINKGKSMLKYGIYGVAVALLAGGMAELVRSVLELGQ